MISSMDRIIVMISHIRAQALRDHRSDSYIILYFVLYNFPTIIILGIKGIMRMISYIREEALLDHISDSTCTIYLFTRYKW